jgi:hypothetical protein
MISHKTVYSTHRLAEKLLSFAFLRNEKLKRIAQLVINITLQFNNKLLLIYIFCELPEVERRVTEHERHLAQFIFIRHIFSS